MCAVLLPSAVNPVAVDRYINVSNRTHRIPPQNPPDAAARNLYSTQLRRERNKVHTLDQLFQQLQGDNRVGMASEHPLKYFMTTRLSADEACQVTLTPVVGTKHLKAWAVPRDSPYTGILNYWYRKTYFVRDTYVVAITEPSKDQPQTTLFKAPVRTEL